MTDDKKPRGELREWTLVFTQYKDTSVGVAYDKAHIPKLLSNDNGIYDVIDKTELLYLQQEIASLRESLKLAVEAIKCAEKYLDSCGYGRKMDDREPEDYMIKDFKQALAKIKAKHGEL